MRQNHEHILFVYGTLLKGQRNYRRYLAPLEPFAKGILDGFRMYDIGSFPGIVEGVGKIKGELYRINDIQLDRIDALEGEGSLYIRKSVPVTTDQGDVEAYIYVYNHSVSDLREIPLDCQPYGRSKRVWYVAYGSNLLEDRLKCYIAGGYCVYNGKTYSKCINANLPTRSVPVTIPYAMFYSNHGLGSWKTSSVCFLDTSKPGKAFGRAYLMDEDQLHWIHQKEGQSDKWYPQLVRLPDIEGMPAYTFGNPYEKKHDSFEEVSPVYAIILYRGMKEAYPEMDGDAILEYLISCGK